MGPNHDHQPDLSPATAVPNLEVASPQDLGSSAERSSQSPEALRSIVAQQAPPLTRPPVPPTNMISVNPTPTPTATTPSTAQNSTNPAVADDKDLIEKEWVNKAKQIVDSTRNDPHKQTKEINLFKADYLKKRYNKELKVVEE